MTRRLMERDVEGKPTMGSNPEVFSYQVADPDQHGCYGMRLRFYGGIEVLAAFTPSEAKPHDLAWMLVDKGITTVFNVGDQRFVFNEGVTGESSAIPIKSL